MTEEKELTPEEILQSKYDSAPHPKSDSFDDKDLKALHVVDRDKILAARKKREGKQDKKAKRSAV